MKLDDFLIQLVKYWKKANITFQPALNVSPSIRCLKQLRINGAARYVEA